MMAAVRAWLSSIVVASLLLSAVRTLMPAGAVRRIGTLTGGLILAAAVLQPLARNRFDLPDWDPARYEAEIQARQEEMARQSADALSRETSERTAALIEARTGFPAEVKTREENGIPLPWSVTLYGERDRAAAAWIASELGIPEDRQVWVGMDENWTVKS